jgi:hypothetical protein
VPSLCEDHSGRQASELKVDRQHDNLPVLVNFLDPWDNHYWKITLEISNGNGKEYRITSSSGVPMAPGARKLCQQVEFAVQLTMLISEIHRINCQQG